MNVRTNALIAMTAAIAVPATLHAAETLNIKLGLWEVTSLTETRGMPPLPKELLDNLSAEQRRKMEADIKAGQAKGPDKDTDQSCITQKDLERPFESANAKECKQTIITTTRTSQEVRIVCSGTVPGSGSLKISTPTAESMVGSLDLKLGAGPDAMTIKSQLKGRWLSADCGDEAEDDENIDDADDDAIDDGTDDDPAA